MKLPSFENVEVWLGKRFARRERSDIVLYISIIAYTILFSALTIVRYHAFKARAWDLGIFTQSLWTTLFAGKFLYHTCELFINPSGSFFGVHFSPILFSVLPFYWIVPSAEMLLILQSFVLALASIPIYKLAKEYAGGRVVGLTFAVAYLIYPATQFVNWYDFHVQIFLPLFFGSAMYYLTKEKWLKFFIFIFLALMVEEHAAFIAFFIGVYLTWKYREQIVSIIKRREPVEKRIYVPFIVMIVASVWYWFTLWQRNVFFPTNPAAVESFLGSANFTILGARDPLEIPILIFLRPLNALQALSYDWQLKLLYLFLLFGPLALFSFKAPSALIPTIPWFGFSLISQTVAHHVLGHQYEAYLVPFIFVAAIFGIRKNFLKQKTVNGISGSLKKIIVCSLIFSVTVSPISPLVTALFPSNTSIYIGEHEILINDVLTLVPPDASILTQDNIFPQVSYRVEAYVVPTIFLNSGIRDLAIEFVNQTMNKVEYLLVDSKTDPAAASLVCSLLENKPQFALISSKDEGTILLFKRVL